MGGLRKAEREGTPAERFPPFVPSLFLRAAEETRTSLALQQQQIQIKSLPSWSFCPHVLLHPEVCFQPAGWVARGGGRFVAVAGCRAVRGGCCERRGWVPTRSITALTVSCKIVLLTKPPSLFWTDGAPNMSRSAHGAPADNVCQCTAMTDYCRIACLCAHGARAQPLFIDFGSFTLP